MTASLRKYLITCCEPTTTWRWSGTLLERKFDSISSEIGIKLSGNIDTWRFSGWILNNEKQFGNDFDDMTSLENEVSFLSHHSTTYDSATTSTIGRETAGDICLAFCFMCRTCLNKDEISVGTRNDPNILIF